MISSGKKKQTKHSCINLPTKMENLDILEYIYMLMCMKQIHLVKIFKQFITDM